MRMIPMSCLVLAVICLALSARFVDGSSAQSVVIDTNGMMGGEPSLELKEYHGYNANGANLAAVSLEGVDLPPHQQLDDGKLLYRNGHGLRSFTFYGLSMKMYVASMYSEQPLRNEQDALACTGCPLMFQFTFLRGVPQGRVKLAWQKQLDWSVSHSYDGFRRDQASFIGMFGAMEEHGTITVKFNGDDTMVWDQGQLKGTIHGQDFQLAFLTMWFGERAVTDDLKLALLGNDTSSAQSTPAAATVAA